MKMYTFGHRGFSGCYPENTMLSFKKAVEVVCVDGIELDVHLSKDDELVIIHDETIDRTTDGKGFVKDKTLAELKALDASYTFPQYKGNDSKIPTFEEYCKYISSTDVITNIEIKTNLIYYKDIEEKTIKMVKKYGLENKVIFSSFNHLSMTFVKSKDSTLRCGLLQPKWGMENAGYLAQKSGMQYYHPDITTLTKEAVQECLDNEILVNAWTVNDMNSLRNCVEWGISGVITNHPDIVKSYLDANGLTK